MRDRIGRLLAVSPALTQCTTATTRPAAWVRSWAAAPQAPLSVQANRPIPDLTDRTLRQMVRLSAGGTRLRIRLRNEMSVRRCGSTR